MKNTRAKTEILEVINNSAVALSHAEIQQVLLTDCDRVTIYRVLDRLVTEHLVHKIVNVDGIVKYAACHDPGPAHNHQHAHFSCVKCLQVTCLEKVLPAFTLPKKFKLQEINFTLSGICAQCS